MHLIPRSPEQSKASASGGPDNCIEPVSPPDGVGEPEHAKSATYPILYREGEQMDQRYHRAWGWDVPGPLLAWTRRTASLCLALRRGPIPA